MCKKTFVLAFGQIESDTFSRVNHSLSTLEGVQIDLTGVAQNKEGVTTQKTTIENMNSRVYLKNRFACTFDRLGSTISEWSLVFFMYQKLR